jgi:hypothetical protein
MCQSHRFYHMTRTWKILSLRISTGIMYPQDLEQLLKFDLGHGYYLTENFCTALKLFIT